MATSYANTNGTGDRRAAITMTKSAISITGTLNLLIDGNTGTTAFFWSGTAAAGHYLQWEFPSPVLIDEAKWYQSSTGSHGTWKWRGSNDGSTWTDIGSSFALGGVTTQTLNSLAGNAAYYKYYRLEGVSGTTSAGPNLREIEFKIQTLSLAASFVDLSTLKVNPAAFVTPATTNFTTPGADTFVIPAYEWLEIDAWGGGAAGAAWVDGAPTSGDLGADGGNTTLTISNSTINFTAGGGKRPLLAAKGAIIGGLGGTPSGVGGESFAGQKGEDGRNSLRIGSTFGGKGGDAPFGGVGGPRGTKVTTGYGNYYSIGEDGTAPGGGGGAAGVGGQAGPPISGDYSYNRALGSGGSGALRRIRIHYMDDGAPEPGETISFNIGAGGASPTGDGSPTLDGGAGANGAVRIKVGLAPVPPSPDTGQGTVTISAPSLRVGAILQATYNNDDPDGGETDFGWQWTRDGSPILYATGDKYQIASADVGADIGVELTYTDDLLYTETISATEVGPALSEAKPLDDLTGNLWAAYGMRLLCASYEGPLFRLLSGTTTSATWGWQHSAGTANSGNYIRFDFGTARIVTEAMLKQNTYTVTVGQGVFQWQGSNDASSWTNIGSNFALNVNLSTAPYALTELNGNSTPYRYYQLLGVSGNWANNLLWEAEFKIDDGGETSRIGLVGGQSYQNPGGEGPRSSMITVTTSFATANISRIVTGKYPDAEKSFWPDPVTGEIVDAEISDWQTAISPITSVSRFAAIYDQSGNARHLLNDTGTVGNHPDAWNSSFVKYTVPNGRWAPFSNGNQFFRKTAMASPQNSLYFMEFIKRDNDRPIISWQWNYAAPKAFQHAVSTANDWLDNNLILHGNGINSGNPRAVTTAAFSGSDTDVVCYEGAQNASRSAIGYNGTFQALSVNNVGYHNEAGTAQFSWPKSESSTDRSARICECVIWDTDVGASDTVDLAKYRLDAMLTWMDELPDVILSSVFEDQSSFSVDFEGVAEGPTLAASFTDNATLTAILDGVNYFGTTEFIDEATFGATLVIPDNPIVPIQMIILNTGR